MNVRTPGDYMAAQTGVQAGDCYSVAFLLMQRRHTVRQSVLESVDAAVLSRFLTHNCINVYGRLLIQPRSGSFVRPRLKQSKRPRRTRPATFAEIRLNAEKRLRRGLKLDFDQIMRDVEELRMRAEQAAKK